MTPSLVDRYRGVVLDVDGVLLRGNRAIDGAAETLTELRRRGTDLAFVTNNAARTPVDLARKLAAAGLPVEPDEIVTSAVATAALLDPATRCLVIGAEGLRQALQERGCVLVDVPDEADAVVVGFTRDLVWDDLRRATLALTRRDVRFVGANADPSFPSSEGLWPGNGAVLAALATASGRTPQIAGKPEPPLFEAAAARLADGPTLMVGDRVETDIAGADRLGWDTALVLTGVTSPEEAERADPPPTYVLADVRALLTAPPR